MKLNRKNNKKGFTIVELVIVIAVIGILSAILIPTFTNLTQDARRAAAKEEVNNAYTAYVMEAAKDGDYLAQSEVAVLRDGQWYTYSTAWSNGDSEKPANVTVEVDEEHPNDYVGTFNNCKVYDNRA